MSYLCFWKGAGSAEIYLHQGLCGTVWEVASGQPDHCSWNLCWCCTFAGKESLFVDYFTWKYSYQDTLFIWKLNVNLKQKMLMGFDFVSSLLSSGEKRQHQSNPCITAVCSFFFFNQLCFSLMSLPVLTSCVASSPDLWYLPCSKPSEWRQSRQSQLVTGEVRWGSPAPQAHTRSTQHTNSSRPAENGEPWARPTFPLSSAAHTHLQTDCL